MSAGTNCIKCGTALPEPRGNRRRYCDPACRRSAEDENKRLNRRIEVMERDLDRLIAAGDCGLRNCFGQTHAESLAGANRAIQLAEQRLKLLLTED